MTNNLTQQQKQHLTLLAIGTVVLLALIYWFVIRSQQVRRDQLRQSLVEVEDKLTSTRRKVAKADQFRANLRSAKRDLQTIENGLPSGDIYFWMLKTLEQFETAYGVDFQKVDPPQPVEFDLLPKVPYGMTLFAINGRATYHDFGRFLAEFENNFPFLRLRSLELEPIAFGSTAPEDREVLRFKMELGSLTKTNRLAL